MINKILLRCVPILWFCGLVILNFALNANNVNPLWITWQNQDFGLQEANKKGENIVIEQQGLGEIGYQTTESRNWFQGTFPALSWEKVKESYREPDLSKQKPGQILRLPCKEIRPDNFNRVHNLMVLGISECGFITTYQNYNTPNIRQLVHLFYIKFPSLNPSASDEKVSPLVFLTGGPGQANTSLSTGSEDLINTLRSAQDYILIDYRGTGMSIPSLGCLPEMMELYLQKDGGSEGISGNAEKYPSLSNCRTRLENNGVNTINFSTRNTALDIKVAITALGYKQADFHAVSYGTKVGLTLLRDHPEVVRSMVLDSIFPVEADGFGETSITLFNTLDEMVVACTKSHRCNPKTFVANMEDFLRRIKHLANKIQNAQANGNDIFEEILKTMSSNEFLLASWPTELEFLLLLSESELESFVINRLVTGVSKYEIIYQYFGDDLGNIDNLKEFIEPGQPQVLGGSPTTKPAPLISLSLLDEFIGFYYSVSCEEEIIPDNLPPRPVYRSRYYSANLVKTLIESLDKYMNEVKVTDCKSWNQYEINNRKVTVKNSITSDLDHAPVKSQLPVLLLSARLDLYTPLLWAQEVKANLPNSYWYISDTGSHDVSMSDPCAVTVMRYFFANPQTFIRQNRKGPTVSCARSPTRLHYEMKE